MDIEVYVGAIMLLPYNFTPSDWAPCNGQTLSIQAYVALYSLIGTTYGGDGKNTFAVPCLNATSSTYGTQPLSTMRYFIALTGFYPARP